MVYSSMNANTASVRPTGAITGVAGGSSWVRAFGSGSPNIRDSVYVTVPRDPTGPVVSTTQIAPIQVRAGVTAGFDIVLDTRSTTIGAATILVGIPNEMVASINAQGLVGNVVLGVDAGLNTLRISLTAPSGLSGVVPIVRVTLTSNAGPASCSTADRDQPAGDVRHQPAEPRGAAPGQHPAGAMIMPSSTRHAAALHPPIPGLLPMSHTTPDRHPAPTAHHHAARHTARRTARHLTGAARRHPARRRLQRRTRDNLAATPGRAAHLCQRLDPRLRHSGARRNRSHDLGLRQGRHRGSGGELHRALPL
jgi:hypothetical protein